MDNVSVGFPSKNKTAVATPMTCGPRSPTSPTASSPLLSFHTDTTGLPPRFVSHREFPLLLLSKRKTDTISSFFVFLLPPTGSREGRGLDRQIRSHVARLLETRVLYCSLHYKGQIKILHCRKAAGVRWCLVRASQSAGEAGQARFHIRPLTSIHPPTCSSSPSLPFFLPPIPNPLLHSRHATPQQAKTGGRVLASSPKSIFLADIIRGQRCARCGSYSSSSPPPSPDSSSSGASTPNRTSSRTTTPPPRGTTARTPPGTPRRSITRSRLLRRQDSGRWWTWQAGGTFGGPLLHHRQNLNPERPGDVP